MINTKRVQSLCLSTTTLNTILILYFSKISHTNWKSFVVMEICYSLREFSNTVVTKSSVYAIVYVKRSNLYGEDTAAYCYFSNYANKMEMGSFNA